jgi:hypothetical protein
VQEAFADLETSTETKKLISRNSSRENYLFIRKLIARHKSYFIHSVQDNVENSRSVTQRFARNIVMDILSELVETISGTEAPPDASMGKFQTKSYSFTHLTNEKTITVRKLTIKLLINL